MESREVAEVLQASFVINLGSRPERMSSFLEANRATGISFERFAASEGTALSDDEAVRINLIKRGTTWRTRGALGAALSHRRLWEQALAAGKPITVFEDDAYIRHDILTVLPPLLDSLPAWDIVYLGYNADAIFEVTVAPRLQLTGQFTPRHADAAHLARFVKSSGPVSLFPLRHAFGLCGYLVSPRGAGRLLANCFPMDNRVLTFSNANVSMPAYSIDGLMNAHLGGTLAAFACVGPLVMPRNDHATSATVGVRDRTR